MSSINNSFYNNITRILNKDNIYISIHPYKEIIDNNIHKEFISLLPIYNIVDDKEIINILENRLAHQFIMLATDRDNNILGVLTYYPKLFKDIHVDGDILITDMIGVFNNNPKVMNKLITAIKRIAKGILADYLLISRFNNKQIISKYYSVNSNNSKE